MIAGIGKALRWTGYGLARVGAIELTSHIGCAEQLADGLYLASGGQGNTRQVLAQERPE
jgi:hypothetical protein